MDNVILEGGRQSGNAVGVVEMMCEIGLGDDEGLERRGGGGSEK